VTTGPTPSSSMIVDPLVLRSSWVVFRRVMSQIPDHEVPFQTGRTGHGGGEMCLCVGGGGEEEGSDW
jgi:hypothetical protein